MNLNECQMPDLQHISEEYAELPARSWPKRFKLVIRRHLSPRQERTFKKYTNSFIDWFYQRIGKDNSLPVQVSQQKANGLEPGDVVRVRSRAEIETTLNHWGQLKGCKFMPEMVQYCNTTQRVLKPMERFVDERELQVKKCKGIILLEGVNCQGTLDFGRCDRACFLFWREEWLEKIE